MAWDPIPARNLIAIGGSAGSIEVIQQILPAVPTDFLAAIVIVVHQSQSSPSVLPRVLSQNSQLLASHAVDGEVLKAGHVYVAPPDRHLLIEREPGSETRPHRRMARSAEQSQNHYMAQRFQERAEESAKQTEIIRRLLLGEPQ